MTPLTTQPQKSDYEPYQELQKEIDTLCKQPVGINGEAFMAAWRESEAIKNRNGGMPPANQIKGTQLCK